MSEIRIKELPADLRPYDKCSVYGPGALSDAELLAVILRTGVKGRNSVTLSQQIMSACTYDEGISSLMHVQFEELIKISGVGRVKALQVMCIGELSKRIARSHSRKRLRFDRPETIAGYYMEILRHEEQEHVYCIMLDTKNRMMSDVLLTKGTINASLITARDVFVKAFSCHAVSVVLVHNHPSGDPTPSNEDILITRSIQSAGKIVGIPLLDHIIIGDSDYMSLHEEGHII